MRSLRRTLILGAVGGMIAVLAFAGALVYVLVRRGLVEQLDRSLMDKARLLASTLERESAEVELEFDELDMSEFSRREGPGYLQLWLADGSVLYRSESLGGRDIERARGAAVESVAARWTPLPGGRTGRSVQLAFLPRSEPPRREEGDAAGGGDGTRAVGPPRANAETITLVLARDAGDVEAVLRSLRAVLFVVGLAATGVSSGVLWLVIRRGLVPLDRVAGQIGRLGGGDLAKRIEAGGTPRELRAVVDGLNGLLGRLEAAFRRERCFSADVAHELRTPLAGLRSTIEVALSRAGRAARYEGALRDCLGAVLRMQAMVERLLSLARMEAGQVQAAPEPVVPDDLLDALWRPMEQDARRRNLRVRRTRGAGRAIRTDPALLALVFGNVLENAVMYADEAGTVEIETAAAAGTLHLRVANTGSTLPQEQVGEIFDRCWRGDASRSAAGAHSGLGLSLVRKAVEILGGSVEATSSPGGSFEIRLSVADVGSSSRP
jgi:signal transduction histidine kinase